MKFRVGVLTAAFLVSGGQAADPSPKALLDQVITALGGLDALTSITGLNIRSSAFRSRAPAQSYALNDNNQLIARAANLSISWQFGSDGLKQRTDRGLAYDDYWRYAHLTQRLDSSLVVQTGSNSSACFNSGGSLTELAIPTGYADNYLTDYLVLTAQQTAFLDIVKKFKASESKLKYSKTRDEIAQTEFPTLSIPSLDLQLLINNGTWLPYAVRSVQPHKIYGPGSTSDIVFSSYIPITFGSKSIKYPKHVQTLINSDYIVEDYVISNVTVNPEFAADFFKADPIVPPSRGSAPFVPKAPKTDAEYPRGEVHEFYESGLWFGPYGQQYNTSNIKVAPVFPNGSVPQIINLYASYPDRPNYILGLIEFDDGFIITDAPPHRPKIILEWLKTYRPGKKITHVVLSHHHHDHATGLGEFLSTGSKLVIPEIAKDYYSNVNGGKFETITYTNDKPFVKKDKNIQFKSYWPKDAPHTNDWTYAVAGPACSSKYNKSEVVLFVADIVNPNTPLGGAWDFAEAQPFFIDTVKRGIPIEALLVGAHGASGFGLGTQDSFMNITTYAGFPYPSSFSEKKDWC